MFGNHPPPTHIWENFPEKNRLFYGSPNLSQSDNDATLQSVCDLSTAADQCLKTLQRGKDKKSLLTKTMDFIACSESLANLI